MLEIRAEHRHDDMSILWALIGDVVAYYNSVACPCAFPRFYQYGKVDCSETRDAYCMLETEGFINKSTDCFDFVEIDRGREDYKAICTCKKCGSTYERAWSDFNGTVNRNYLKPLLIKARQLGSDAETNIPYVLGLMGQGSPDVSNFKKMTYAGFKNYVQAMKEV